MKAVVWSHEVDGRARRNGVLFILLLLAAAFYVGYRQSSGDSGERLQFAIATMPRGIAAAEADRLIGGRPHAVYQMSGVLHNNMLLDAANSQAALYGKAQPYEVRIWRLGGVNAAVVVDQQGKVASRYTWRNDRRRNGGFFESLSFADSR